MSAEPAIEGQGGDLHTYNVACRVRDFGVSQSRCLELMSILWDSRCLPRGTRTEVKCQCL
jgi:hypothetical protein